MHSFLKRRDFLRATGVAIALPMLESLPVTASDARRAPRRMVCVGNEFGMYPNAFWPKQDGAEYEFTPLLQPLADLRDQFTLFSHLDHGLKGGHFAVHTYLTGVKAVDAKGMEDGGISLDQRAAEHVGASTRFPALTIGSADGLHGGCQMSWTRSGTRVPPIPGPRELFRRLFVDDDTQAKRKALDRLALQGSILDAVSGDAKSLKRRVSKTDEQKLEEYFASIRDVEAKLQLQKQWQDIPKPKTELAEPTNEGLARDLPMIYDLIVLALQTDSTRVATIEVGGTFVASDLGVRKGYHSLSHHGQVKESIDLLVQLEKYQVEQYARFLGKLAEAKDPHSDKSLLDQTMVLFGSGMGNGNSHTNNDLPILLAGGGFRHGRHLRLPSQDRERLPLSNLYLSMLQQFGVETDRFSHSTGTLRGLESV